MGVTRKAYLGRSGVNDIMAWTNNTGADVAVGDIILTETNTLVLVAQQNIANGATGTVWRKGEFYSSNYGSITNVDSGDPIYYNPTTKAFAASGNVGGSTPPYKIGIFTDPIAADGTSPSDASFMGNTAIKYSING